MKKLVAVLCLIAVGLSGCIIHDHGHHRGHHYDRGYHHDYDGHRGGRYHR